MKESQFIGTLMPSHPYFQPIIEAIREKYQLPEVDPDGKPIKEIYLGDHLIFGKFTKSKATDFSVAFSCLKAVSTCTVQHVQWDRRDQAGSIARSETLREHSRLLITGLALPCRWVSLWESL